MAITIKKAVEIAKDNTLFTINRYGKEKFVGFRDSNQEMVISIDNEFKQMIDRLFTFMNGGYGEHRDFRNMGTDYEGRDKVYKFVEQLNKDCKN